MLSLFVHTVLSAQRLPCPCGIISPKGIPEPTAIAITSMNLFSVGARGTAVFVAMSRISASESRARPSLLSVIVDGQHEPRHLEDATIKGAW